jgi:hypothetical protein
MDPCQQENYDSHSDGNKNIEDLDILSQQPALLLLFSFLRVPSMSTTQLAA